MGSASRPEAPVSPARGAGNVASGTQCAARATSVVTVSTISSFMLNDTITLFSRVSEDVAFHFEEDPRLESAPFEPFNTLAEAGRCNFKHIDSRLIFFFYLSRCVLAQRS